MLQEEMNQEKSKHPDFAEHFGLDEDPSGDLPFSEDELIDEKEDAVVVLRTADLSTMSPQEYADILKLRVMNGNATFDEMIKLVKLRKTIEFLMKDGEVKAWIEEEANKYGKDNTLYGMRFIVKKAGVRYDYSGCNHPGLNAALELKAQLDKYIKAVEAQLKALPEQGMTVAIDEVPKPKLTMEDSGEMVDLLPPLMKAGTTVEFKPV